MVLKNSVVKKKTSFTRGAYYWLMFMIDNYQSVRTILKIDYESFIIIQTVISHFLYSMNKEEDADWKRMWKLAGDKKAKENLSKSKLITASISLVAGLPRETVRRKLLELNKKKILVLDKKRGLQLGENVINHSLRWVKKVGLLGINIEDEIKIDKNKLLSKLDDVKKNYSNYIKSFIAPDGNNLGYEKIIKILKERFF
jgi:hypothetical protein